MHSLGRFALVLPFLLLGVGCSEDSEETAIADTFTETFAERNWLGDRMDEAECLTRTVFDTIGTDALIQADVMSSDGRYFRDPLVGDRELQEKWIEAFTLCIDMAAHYGSLHHSAATLDFPDKSSDEALLDEAIACTETLPADFLVDKYSSRLLDDVELDPELEARLDQCQDDAEERTAR